MNEIRILLISPYFFPHIGGSQRYMEELYAHIVRKHRSVQVDVLAYNTMGVTKREKYRGMTIFRIPCWQILPGQFALPHPIHLISALWNLAKRKPQIVHTHIRFFDACWWAWLFAKCIGAVSVFSEHVAAHPVHRSAIVCWVGTIVDFTLARWSISRYNVVTVTNRGAKKFLSTTLGVPNPMSIVWGGVDTKRFAPARRKYIRQVPGILKRFRPSDTIVTYAGRIIWSKGVIYLYHAIRDGNASFPKNVHFVIAGDGDLASELRNLIARDGLNNRVHFTGSLQSNQVRDLLRQTDIFIYPSHHSEGFPNSILEAGACGNFVIATDNAGVKDIVTHGQSGMLVKQKSVRAIRDGIIWALDHRDQRISMGKKLRRHIVENFTWNDISKGFYDDVLSKRPVYRSDLGLYAYLAHSLS